LTAKHRWIGLARLALIGLVLCVAGCDKPAPKAVPRRSSLDAETIPLGRLPRVAIPLRYRVALKIDPKSDHFSGHTEIDVKFLTPRRALFLHGLGLYVSGVTIKLKSGQSFPVHYDQVDPSGVARLIFVDKVPAGEATLIFDYDAPYNTSLEGLYKVVDRGDSYAFTQFENTDARRAFPSFDEPGFKTPFDITVIAPKGQKVIGNTPIISARPSKNGMVDTVFATTEALPTYLVAIAVGPLDVVDGGFAPPNAWRSKPLHIRGVTARGNGGRIAYALSLTPKIVTAFEEYFGIGFPFQKLDVLAVPDFGPGAMENAGAITFRERLLLIDPDAPIEQKRASLTVQAHEIAHQWFGDLVTPAWWDDIWLNESFANWAEYKAAAAVLPEDDFATDLVRENVDVMDLDELPSARQIHQPIQNIDDLANAFDGITYDKGASVLAMFEHYVGPEGWRQGIHAYLKKFSRRNATADDFIGTIAAKTDRPGLVRAFHDFIDRPGIPDLAFRGGCDGDTGKMTQSAYAPFGFTPPQRSWHVPVCIAGSEGTLCTLTDEHTAPPSAGLCSIPLSFNAEGVGYYRFALDAEVWKRQITVAGKLDAAGQITLLGNGFAGLRNGGAKAEDVLAAIRAVAPTARWDVLRSLSKRLFMLRASLGANDLPAYRAFLSKVFLPRWKAVGAGSKPADLLLRQYLATLLVTEARDPGVIKQIAAPILCQARPSHSCQPAMAPELRAEAMRAAIIADPSVADLLLATFQSTNQETYRREIIYAFAGSGDPKIIEKLLTLALDKIRIGELRYLREYLADEPVARETFWAFVKAHYSAFEKRLTQWGMSGMAEILQNACDAQAIGEANDFFHGKLKGARGAARRNAHTVERIHRCIALRDAKGSEIAAALQSAR
jgi:alanyl aminopeptidase